MGLNYEFASQITTSNKVLLVSDLYPEYVEFVKIKTTEALVLEQQRVS